MTQSTAQTTNGLRPGDTITYREFGHAKSFTVISVEYSGTVVRLADALGDIGYSVSARQCTLTARPGARTEPSADFPHVGSELNWTSPDGRTTIRVRRGDLTYTVEVYQGTLRIDDKCTAHATEAEARGTARMWAAMAAADAARNAEQTSRIAPATAVRHTTSMSPQQATAILAAEPGGVIHRGRGNGQLTLTQLKALHNRGYGTAYLDDNGEINQLVVTAAGLARATSVTRARKASGTSLAPVVPLTIRTATNHKLAA